MQTREEVGPIVAAAALRQRRGQKDQAQPERFFLHEITPCAKRRVTATMPPRSSWQVEIGFVVAGIRVAIRHGKRLRLRAMPGPWARPVSFHPARKVCAGNDTTQPVKVNRE